MTWFDVLSPTSWRASLKTSKWIFTSTHKYVPYIHTHTHAWTHRHTHTHTHVHALTLTGTHTHTDGPYSCQSIVCVPAALKNLEDCLKSMKAVLKRTQMRTHTNGSTLGTVSRHTHIDTDTQAFLQFRKLFLCVLFCKVKVLKLWPWRCIQLF